LNNFHGKKIINSIVLSPLVQKVVKTTKEHTISLKFPKARHKGGGWGLKEFERIRTW
jgi:hypothetical protein